MLTIPNILLSPGSKIILLAPQQGRRNTWHLFPGQVAAGVLGYGHCAMPFWKSAIVLEDYSQKRGRGWVFTLLGHLSTTTTLNRMNTKLRTEKIKKSLSPKPSLRA